MSQNGTPQYFYDAENHMTSASGGYSYIYDGDGNRVEKCTAGPTAGTCAASPTGTLYWTDTGGNNISETDLAGNLQQEYMFFGKRVGRRESNGDIRWYFSDHLGTADVIAYTTGSIKSESDYYPYDSCSARNSFVSHFHQIDCLHSPQRSHGTWTSFAALTR
jgi:hypothetical protein